MRSYHTDVFSLSGFFKKRLSFVLKKLANKKAALWKNGELDIFPYTEFEKPSYDASEKDFRKMWKDFYDTVAVEGRENEKCRMTHMPKRFWKYMPEFT